MASTNAAQLDKVEVTVCRGYTGAIQTFTLRAGGVLRIGRGVANDIVLDFTGVSIYHAELYLKPSSAESEQTLCIRDDSKNGTGVRAGPHAQDAEGVATWEPLKKGALRVLEYGWQVLVPLRSRKESNQLPEMMRVLTIFTGSRPPALADEELDGEVWEPIQAASLGVAKMSKALPVAEAPPPPPPPDLGGGAFEEAPPPPEEPGVAERHLKARGAFLGQARAQAPGPKARAPRVVATVKKQAVAPAAKGAESDEEDEEPQGQVQAQGREERKREKKEKKRLKQEKEEGLAGKKEKKEKKKKKRLDQESDQEESKEAEDDERQARKRDKKEKKARKKAEKEKVAQATEEPQPGEDSQAEDAEKRLSDMNERKKKEMEQWERKKKEREERERLEQELENELNEEVVRKERVKKREQARKEQEKEELERIEKTRQTQEKLDSEARAEDSGVEEEDDLQAAWGKALAPAAPAAIEPPSARAVADSAEAPASVEVSDVEGATGIFLRYGLTDGHPLYRRIDKDEVQPAFLFYWDGAESKEEKAGWYVASEPSAAGAGEGFAEFWPGEPRLPVSGPGKNGGRMEARTQLDASALDSLLQQLPEEARSKAQAAFSATSRGLASGEVEPAGTAGTADGELPATSSGTPLQTGAPPTPAEHQIREALVAAGAAAKAQEAGVEAEGGQGEVGDAAAAAGAAAAPMLEKEGAEELQGAEATSVPPLVGEPDGPADGGEPETAAVEVEVEIGDENAAESTHVPGSPEEKKATEAAVADDEVAAAEPAGADSPVETEPTNVLLAKDESVAPASAAPTGAAPGATEGEAAGEAEAEADRESLPSRVSATTTNPQKTVPGDRGESLPPTQVGDRGESVAPTQAGDQGERMEAEAGEKAKAKTAELTTEALAKHTAALAKAQAEAYAATFASAKSQYSKSLAGKSVAGRTVAGRSITGMSIAGKSIAGKSIAGRSIAASGVVASEKTFRTHMTARELLVGASVMRELMRSVSPISTPGVPVKRRRRGGSPTGSPQRKRKEKKKKKDKKDKAGETTGLRKAKPSKVEKAKLIRTASPSHYALQSPTPYRGRMEPSATPHDPPKEASASVQPSHWMASNLPSSTPQPQQSDTESHLEAAAPAPKAKKKAAKASVTAAAATDHTDHWVPARDASPCSSTSAGREAVPLQKPKRRRRERGVRQVELRDAETQEDAAGRGRSPEPKRRAQGNKEAKRKKRSPSAKRKRKRSPPE